MICIAYSDQDPVSKSAAESISEEYELREWRGAMAYGDISLVKVDGQLTHAERLDSMGFTHIFFMSKHFSSAGIASFTAHSLGNWTDEAAVGGKPHRLSVASPQMMLSCIRNLKKTAPEGLNNTFEATHHGPLLETPSVFVEFGGSEEKLNGKPYASAVGLATMEAAIRLSEHGEEFERAVIGIGGTHYPQKFTRLAIEKGYGFAHIMPRYAFIKVGGSENTGMVAEAISRSETEIELAVIEWKSLGSLLRGSVLEKLNEIGIDYERV